jgi:hypothetical protein
MIARSSKERDVFMLFVKKIQNINNDKDKIASRVIKHGT